jgi:hypothetical protein
MGLAATVAPHREPATQGFAQGVEGFGNTAGSDDPVTPERDKCDVVMEKRGQAAVDPIDAADPGRHR